MRHATPRGLRRRVCPDEAALVTPPVLNPCETPFNFTMRTRSGRWQFAQSGTTGPYDDVCDTSCNGIRGSESGDRADSTAIEACRSVEFLTKRG
jgi:hypothetical protein